MSSSFERPRVTRNTQATHITYELPHRIHASAVYPARSPNGSSVTLYGHENGVRVIWRGGRPFKPSKTSTNAPSKTNGSDNAVITIDSDEEDTSANKYEDQVEFEDEEDELDQSQPCPKILQSLDLFLGAEVLHLAVLPASMTSSNTPLPKGYESISNKIMFTAACSDNYVRLVTLPLTPPSPASKSRAEFRRHPYNTVVGHGSWGETITRLLGHQRPVDGISMTLNIVNNSRDLAKTDAKSHPRPDPSVIVSSHSREATGLLLVFRVPLSSSIEQLEPHQTVYLPSPATSIAFNTSTSAPRSSHLLVAESSGVCRIYDYSLLSRSSDEAQQPSSLQGSWLLSLYPGFKDLKSEQSIKSNGLHAGYGRKTVIDAKWVSGGRAVIILLNDGEWAVWDIEGTGPGSSKGLLGREGIKGGSKSGYSISGFLESSSRLRAGLSQPAVSKFAPMTPGTRKSAEPFGARQQTSTCRGQISVLEIPPSPSVIQSDDSIAFWYGDTFAVIPSLLKYWSSHQSSTGNPFAGTSGGRIIKLEGIDFRGETCCGIDQIPRLQSSNGLPELLILGEHRFIILVVDKQNRQPQFRGSGKLALEQSTNSGDLEDIDRALAILDNSSKMDLF